MKLIHPIALLMTLLIVSIPYCFAATYNLVYDANGNLVTGDGLYRDYNSLNQLWRIRNGSNSTAPIIEEYTYHPVEERVLVKKMYNSTGNLTESVYYVNENLIRVVNSSGTFDTTYVYHEGQLIAQQNSDGSKLFYHPDHLGSTTLITNASGGVVENTSYTPFGEVVLGGQKSRFQYEGKEYDSKVKQYDFQFRGYKPEWGIFATPDSLLPNVYDPQTLNRFMFEKGNPWKNTDSTGHYWQIPLGGAILGAAFETYIQLSSAGRIYSGWRIGGAALIGAAETTLAVATAPAPAIGIPVDLAMLAYDIYSYGSSVESALAHREPKKLEKPPEEIDLSKIKKPLSDDDTIPQTPQLKNLDLAMKITHQSNGGGGGYIENDGPINPPATCETHCYGEIIGCISIC